MTKPRRHKIERQKPDAQARRLVQRKGPMRVVRIGHRRDLRDLYHWLLTLSWPRYLGLVGLWYIGANISFAILYLLDRESIAEARPGSFEDAFFFSVQTFATIGYGVMHPQTRYANIIMTFETLTGLIGFAVVTGLIFARFSRPTARVLFSRVAVISEIDRVPTLSFRCANQRRNQILEAQVGLTLLRNEYTAEGHAMRRFHDMKLARGRTPVFSLTWTVMHPIDRDSPLFGLTHEDLMAQEAEIIVVLSGTDDTFAQAIQTRHSYVASEICWNARFVDILNLLDDGRAAIDYGRFHDIVPAEQPALPQSSCASRISSPSTTIGSASSDLP